MIVDPQGRFPIRLAIIICNQKVNAKLTVKLYERLDPSDKASYRHVSILSLVSKGFEKICMIKFMHTLNIFSNKFLCGFPKVHSTEHALFTLIQQWQWELDSEGFVDTILMDLLRAYHYLSYNLLMTKLEVYGHITTV